MANEKLKKFFATKLVGVQADRIAVRTQGCWSCIHGDAEAAAKRWWDEARQKLLTQALDIAMNSPAGEDHPKVKAIRQQVPMMDSQMAAKQFVACHVGRDPKGNPVGDFVHCTYLCDRWTARQGASIARAGSAPDRLPEELHQRFDDDGTTD